MVVGARRAAAALLLEDILIIEAHSMSAGEVPPNALLPSPLSSVPILVVPLFLSHRLPLLIIQPLVVCLDGTA